MDILLCEDNVPHEELESIREWLVANDGHADEKAEIFVRKFAGQMKRGENRETARRLWPSLAKRLGIATVRKAAVRRPAYQRTAFRIAAVTIPAIALTFMLWNRQSLPQEPVMAMTTITATDTMATEQGYTQHTLPDQSTVKLAEGSTLKYADNFEKERYVELEGEAHFKVTKTANNFEIRANDMKISVLGTMFKANSRTGEIGLYHGSVSVEAAGKQLAMTPGQHLKYDRAAGQIKITNIPLQERYYDEMPGLVFEGTLLPEVLATMERDYGVRFRIENGSSLRTQEIFGDFTGFGTIGQFMAMLQNISGKFTYTVTSDVVIIHGI